MSRTRAPVWFWIVTIVLILWGLSGIYEFYSSGTAAARAAMDASDRGLIDSLPRWYRPVYALAVWAGLAGSVLLALRRRLARPVFIVSLVGIVVMFGWMFVATDLVAVKGVAIATGFPIFIAAMGLFQIWLADHAEKHGWIG